MQVEALYVSGRPLNPTGPCQSAMCLSQTARYRDLWNARGMDSVRDL